MKINIGSGTNWNKINWKTIDFDNKTEHIIDLRNSYSIPLDDNECKKIYCSHFIEHLADHSVSNLFKEAYRVLEYGGIFRISCLDVEKAINEYKIGNEDFFHEKELLLKGDNLEDRLLNFISSFKCYRYGGKENYIGGPIGHAEDVKNKINLPIDEFVHWATSQIPENAYYKSHINGWYFSKIKIFLEKSGFEVIFKSSYQNSCDEELRQECFDNRPIQSVFVEAIKLPGEFRCRGCGETKDFSYVKLNPEFGVPITKCNNCGFVQSAPVPPQYLDYYYKKQFRLERTNYNSNQLEFFDLRARYQKEFIEKYSSMITFEKVLDIGSGIGALPKLFSKTCDKTFAYDPDPKIGHYYNESNIIFFDDINLVNNEKDSFDLVTCSHVFEHVLEPYSFLNNISELLKEDGYLFLEVPLESIEFLNSKKFVTGSGHFNHYNMDYLVKFLGNLNSFKLVQWELSGPSLSGFINGTEDLKSNLLNKGQDGNYIHFRALLKKNNISMYDTQTELNLSYFFEYIRSVEKSLSSAKASITKFENNISKIESTNINLKLKNNKMEEDVSRLEDELKKLEISLSHEKNKHDTMKTNMITKNAKLKKELDKFRKDLSLIQKSSSWKLTKPLRFVVGKVKSLLM
ncbi:methyltransferase domain-containing protein [Vibrio plantisponsor]|uniref:Methyltransferase domain-containing protein n=1 Tax=Vibrio plantisponsor TaxID=664643 RepID=A0ABU4IJM0_9VIBR|nr:methyltransferase domain-containing protein [Vibrio plantisponsor]MDW6018304.1 methyltransferase domain-containing protein [Vibrio plantisponsor]NNM42470.1 methyltransferase domain-containing protein [Vibrio plantisponsor]